MTAPSAARERVVVACRLPRGRARAGLRGYVERARALARRAEVLGAELVAWGAQSVAFAWDPELLEEAIALVVDLGETDEGAWACGVAEGALEPVDLGGRRATLAWGPPLLAAASLARLAGPGEALLDVGMRAVARGDLSTTEVREGEGIDGDVRGAALDRFSPWRTSPSRPPRATEDAETYAGRILELGRITMRRIEAIGGANPSPSEALGERMRAVARLSRGQVAEALSSLERVRDEAASASHGARCQASLALALALLSAGRPDECMLEALDALAHARAAEDTRAAGACIALLAKLFARVGRAQDAERLAEELALYPRSSVLPPVPASS